MLWDFEVLDLFFRFGVPNNTCHQQAGPGAFQAGPDALQAGPGAPRIVAIVRSYVPAAVQDLRGWPPTAYSAPS